jgi:hypothetical protein
MARLRVSWLAGGAGQLDAGNHGAGISDQLPIDGKLNIAVTVGLGGGPEDKPITMLQNAHRPDTEQTLYVLRTA